MGWQYCVYCGKRFTTKNNRIQKYCSETCAKNAHRDKNRDNMWKKRHGENSLYKYVVPIEYTDKNGKATREFSYIVENGSKGTSQTNHANPDFEKEAILIKKEKKRLGLNG